MSNYQLTIIFHIMKTLLLLTACSLLLVGPLPRSCSQLHSRSYIVIARIDTPVIVNFQVDSKPQQSIFVRKFRQIHTSNLMWSLPNSPNPDLDGITNVSVTIMDTTLHFKNSDWEVSETGGTYYLQIDSTMLPQ